MNTKLGGVRRLAIDLGLGLAAIGSAAILLALWYTPAHAEIATMKSGMQFTGRIGKIGSLGEDPLNEKGTVGDVQVKQIVLVDDDLRRTFFSTLQTQSVVPDQTNHERITIDQRVFKGSRRVGSVGPIIKVTPFDSWGRRIFTMNTSKGPIDVIQGITEVTPIYTKVEGLMAASPYAWDMRVATSSIPRETLSQILLKQVDPKDPDARLRVVRLYIQSERFRDAQAELQDVIKEFPELADLTKQVNALQQLGAKRLIDEIELRKAASQHRLAVGMLENFPSKGVAGEILLQVSELLKEYSDLRMQGEQLLVSLEKHAAEIKNEATRTEVEPILAEMKRELNITTFDRMADYLRLADDTKMTSEQKVALAISGWILGSGAGTENLAVATSLFQVRELARKYLASNSVAERGELLREMETLEGSTPSFLTKIVANMKPAIDAPTPAEDAPPGFFQLAVKGLDEQADIEYFLQLPPEYDPYRRYPCIITLNGAGTTAEQQIDWWAGAFSSEVKMRTGQAARRGYIVIAPVWTKPHQRQYEYSAREHAAVLYPLRDACRRFSIDTDRVFLSGHSMGGDAVWDIGLAHPDLWAGVVPVVASADKYVSRYWENGRYVPFYFVAGEMDGDKRAKNAVDLDRYLNKHSYDVTLVEYLGRGHEHFHDEIQRMFEWMELHKRVFFPRDFECVTMRPWDNFFWWAEIDEMPSRSIVVPANWPPPTSLRPARTEGHILENNRITLRTGAERATVWLSPEMVDFSKPIAVSIDGRSRNQPIEASREVLLEDIRTRGDRQHPFWAKVEAPFGRSN